MEKESKERIPPIFKVSVLFNILPYYGHLHRWRRLLEKIWTLTKAMWEENIEALIYWGRNCKRELLIDKDIVLKEIKKDWLDLFSLTLTNSLDKQNYKSNFHSSENENLVAFLISRSNENDAIIIDTHCSNVQRLQVYFCRQEIISNYLPSVLCPSFSPWIKKFSLCDISQIYEYTVNELSLKSVIFIKSGQEIIAYSSISSVLKLENGLCLNKFNEEGIMNKYGWCSSNKCDWKPIKLFISKVF